MQPSRISSSASKDELITTINPLYKHAASQNPKKPQHKRTSSVPQVTNVTEQVVQLALADTKSKSGSQLRKSDRTIVVPPLAKELPAPAPSPTSSESSSSPLSANSLPQKSAITASTDSLASFCESESSSSTRKTRSKSISGAAFKVTDAFLLKKGSKTAEDLKAKPPEPIVLETSLLKIVEEYLGGNEKALSMQFLRSLTPKTRVTLQKWLRQTPSNAQLTVQEALKRIHQAQESLKNETLLRAILSSKESVTDAFCLANFMIIEPEDLFTLINEELHGTHFTGDEKHVLVLFSIRWIHENAGTKCFLKTPAVFPALLKTCQDHALSKIRECAPQLQLCLNKAHLAKPASPFFSEFEQPTDTTTTFAKFIQELLSSPKEVQEFHETTTKIAKDLMQYQIQIYLALRPNDFAKRKWRETPLNVARSSRFQDALAFFVADFILAQENKEQRTKVIRFFLALSRYTFENRDFSSTMALCTGLNNASVQRLKATWEQVMRFPQEVEQLQFLNTHFGFDKDYNYQQLRKLISKSGSKEKFLPYLGIVKKDLELLTEKPRIVHDVHGEPQYNIDNMQQTREFIIKIFSHQDSFRIERKSIKPYCDIVALALKNLPKDDEGLDANATTRHDKSKELEPPKQIDH